MLKKKKKQNGSYPWEEIGIYIYIHIHINIYKQKIQKCITYKRKFWIWNQRYNLSISMLTHFVLFRLNSRYKQIFRFHTKQQIYSTHKLQFDRTQRQNYWYNYNNKYNYLFSNVGLTTHILSIRHNCLNKENTQQSTTVRNASKFIFVTTAAAKK